MQEAITKENTDRPVSERMRFRIGIHVGDIMVQGDNLFGDAVNIAARLEALAEPVGFAYRALCGTLVSASAISRPPRAINRSL